MQPAQHTQGLPEGPQTGSPRPSAPLPPHSEHPRGKTETQLPIRWQPQREQGDLIARQVPACPGKPRQVQGMGHVPTPGPATLSPARLRHAPRSPSSSRRGGPGATMQLRPESRLRAAERGRTGARSPSPPTGVAPLRSLPSSTGRAGR